MVWNFLCGQQKKSSVYIEVASRRRKLGLDMTGEVCIVSAIDGIHSTQYIVLCEPYTVRLVQGRLALLAWPASQLAGTPSLPRPTKMWRNHYVP